MADTSTITITNPAPTLERVEITPASANLQPGGAQQFAATGRMSNGTTTPVNVNWSATGGTINGSGRYTAGSTEGTFRVIAVRQEQLAMMLNLIVAALAGMFIPLAMERFGRDPAVGSSVFLTFMTDSMGFFIFLGLATAFLL